MDTNTKLNFLLLFCQNPLELVPVLCMYIVPANDLNSDKSKTQLRPLYPPATVAKQKSAQTEYTKRY